MIAGATRQLLEKVKAGEVHAVLGLGGFQGTSACCSVMQALPYGLPKVMLSTAASSFEELRDKVLACRLCAAQRGSWTISVVGRGGEPAAFASLEQLPEPKTVRGVRKVCAKLHVAWSSEAEPSASTWTSPAGS